MLSVRQSPSKGRNPDFNQAKRQGAEDNVAWLVRNSPKDNRPCLILLGGNDTLNFRLRTAQSHARHSVTPSHWSHVALLGVAGNQLRASDAASAGIWEISLEPVGGFGFPPLANGVQSASLSRYQNPQHWPNIALVYVPVELEALRHMVARFKNQRSAIDSCDLILSWLAFAWGVGRSPNPLLDGRGVPSATFVEYILGGLQYELTPGLESRSSCPEMIWQSALWWHSYYKESGGRTLEGAWVVDHGLVDDPQRQ